MSQITEEQRYKIEVLIQEGYSQTQISKAIGKHKSVICRELKRNCDKRNGKYRATLAHRRCNERHSNKNKKIYFTLKIKEYVEALLNEEYSPEQIVGISKRTGSDCVSAERIYQHIWKNKKQGGELYLKLRTTGKPYRKRGTSKDKRGQIVNRVSIKERPEVVDKKERIGDLEADLIVGAGQSGYLITINDRATGVVKIVKSDTKEASVIQEKINRQIKIVIMTALLLR